MLNFELHFFFLSVYVRSFEMHVCFLNGHYHGHGRTTMIMEHITIKYQGIICIKYSGLDGKTVTGRFERYCPLFIGLTSP